MEINMIKKVICVHCKKETVTKDYFCTHCNKILPLNFKDLKHNKSWNYFTYLKLPSIAHDLNMSELDLLYIRAIRKMHPDKYINKSQQEREYAMEHSLILNQAYRVLYDYLERIAYILLLNKHPVEEDGKSTDQSFLCDMFEISENIEFSDVEILENIKKNMLDQEREVASIINYAIAKKDWESVRDGYYKMKFMDKIQQFIRARIVELSPDEEWVV